MINVARSRLSIYFVLFSAVIFILLAAACQQSESNGTPTDLPTPPLAATPESVAGYPAPDNTPDDNSSPPASSTPIAYPVSPESTEPSSKITPTSTPQPTTFKPTSDIYIPFVALGEQPTPTPVPPTPTPTIDFAAVRAGLQAQGQDLGFAKIGFHTGVGGNRTGIGEWMRRLDAAGVPFFLKTADDTGPLVEAQEIMRNSNVPHTIVYRRSGDEYDTPNYDLPAAEAARQHWQLHMDGFPVELDPSLIWLETLNEIDKGRAEWLGQFALETARLPSEWFSLGRLRLVFR